MNDAYLTRLARRTWPAAEVARILINNVPAYMLLIPDRREILLGRQFREAKETMLHRARREHTTNARDEVRQPGG